MRNDVDSNNKIQSTVNTAGVEMVGLVIPQDERLSSSDLSPPPRPRLTGHRRIYVAFKSCRGRPIRSQEKKKRKENHCRSDDGYFLLTAG